MEESEPSATVALLDMKHGIHSHLKIGRVQCYFQTWHLLRPFRPPFKPQLAMLEIQNIIQILGLDLGKISPLKGVRRVRHCQRKSQESIVQSYVCYVCYLCYLCYVCKVLEVVQTRNMLSPLEACACENFCVALIVQRIMRRRSRTSCHHACSSGQSQSIDPLHFWWPETGGIPPLAFEIPQLFRRMDVRSHIDQPSCTSSAVQLRFRFGAAESLWLGEITSLRGVLWSWQIRTSPYRCGCSCWESLVVACATTLKSMMENVGIHVFISKLNA